MKIKLSVIVPMYNTAHIASNIKAYIKSLEKFEKNYEIIIVNDGSTDNSLNEARSVKSKKVKVISYCKNKGKGYAIKHGFNFAQGEFIAFLDSGGEFDAVLLKDFMSRMKKENADIVVGSKRHPKSIVHYPLTRRVMSRTYQMMNKILFNLSISDSQVGIKLFKREVLERIIPKILVKKFAFDIEILAIAHRYGYKITEAPIVMNYKFGSTINPKSVFWMLWDTLAVFYRLRIMRWYD